MLWAFFDFHKQQSFFFILQPLRKKSKGFLGGRGEKGGRGKKGENIRK